MISFLFCMVLAQGADVDLGPSGSVVTVRPSAGEEVAILSASGEKVALPQNMHQPMWLVHPESWRKAVALAEKYNAQLALPVELQSMNRQLESELESEKQIRSQMRIDLEASEATRMSDNKALRSSRARMMIVTGVSGLLLGAAGTALIVL